MSPSLVSGVTQQKLSLGTAEAMDQSLLNLLDLSAAFETLKHQILLSSFSEGDISGPVLDWFRSELGRPVSDPQYLLRWSFFLNNTNPSSSS